MQQHAVVFQESKHWEAGTAQRRWTQPCDCRLARGVKRSAPCAETDELRNKTSSVIKCLRHLSEPQMKSGSKKLKDQIVGSFGCSSPQTRFQGAAGSILGSGITAISLGAGGA